MNEIEKAIEQIKKEIGFIQNNINTDRVVGKF